MLNYTDSIQLFDFLQIKNLAIVPILLGLELGLAYAAFASAMLHTPVLRNESLKQREMLLQLRMSLPDMLFLSLCAGIGEELLFRSGLQYYLGPELTALIFVALHGYYHPLNWKKSLYGILVTPFIFLLAYGFDYFGLWFCIAAHFAYDFLLFILYGKRKKFS